MQERIAGECATMTGMVMFSSFARKGHREVRQLLEKITGLRGPFLFKMRDLQQSVLIRLIGWGAENDDAGEQKRCP